MVTVSGLEAVGSCAQVGMCVVVVGIAVTSAL